MPINAHEASAFMSFNSTKETINRAWMESRFGLKNEPLASEGSSYPFSST